MTRLNLLIILFAVLLVAAYGSWLLSTFKSVTRDEPAEKRHNVDYYLDDISATLMDASGKPRYKLTASRLEHYADDNSIEISKPVLKVMKNNKREWNIIADSGVILNNGNEIQLLGKVTIKQGKNSRQPTTNLYTRNLRIHVPEEYAETDEKVLIKHNGSQLSGTGMKLYLSENRLELLANSRGTYVVSP